MDQMQQRRLIQSFNLITNPQNDLSAEARQELCNKIRDEVHNDAEASSFLAIAAYTKAASDRTASDQKEHALMLFSSLADNQEVVNAISGMIEFTTLAANISGVAPIVRAVGFNKPGNHASLAKGLAGAFCQLSHNPMNNGNPTSIKNASYALIEVGGKEELCQALETVKATSPSAAGFLASITCLN